MFFLDPTVAQVTYKDVIRSKRDVGLQLIGLGTLFFSNVAPLGTIFNFSERAEKFSEKMGQVSPLFLTARDKNCIGFALRGIKECKKDLPSLLLAILQIVRSFLSTSFALLNFFEKKCESTQALFGKFDKAYRLVGSLFILLRILSEIYGIIEKNSRARLLSEIYGSIEKNSRARILSEISERIKESSRAHILSKIDEGVEKSSRAHILSKIDEGVEKSSRAHVLSEIDEDVEKSSRDDDSENTDISEEIKDSSRERFVAGLIVSVPALIKAASLASALLGKKNLPPLMNLSFGLSQLFINTDRFGSNIDKAFIYC